MGSLQGKRLHVVSQVCCHCPHRCLHQCLQPLLQPARQLAQETVGVGLVSLPLWSQGEEEVEQVPAETLYQGLLPSLPQYMVSPSSGSSLPASASSPS